LRQSIEDMEQEFALRRGGVHLLGQRNVPPRVFRYRRAPATQPQAPFSAEFGGFRSAGVLALSAYATKMGRSLVPAEKCIKPALLEVNALADHGVSLEPLRRGKSVYGVKMRWWKKNRNEREAAYRELQRSKVGRLPRLKGTVVKIVGG